MINVNAHQKNKILLQFKLEKKANNINVRNLSMKNIF